MKILMIGPGYGSNMRLWMDYMNNQNIDELYLLATTQLSDEFKAYSNINTCYSLSGNLLRDLICVCYQLKKHKFDVIHIQGAYNKKLVRLVCSLFKGKIVLNIWGQWYVDGLINGKDKYFLDIAKKVDYIFVNWWDALLQIENEFPEFNDKLKLTRWGVSEKNIADFNKSFNEDCLDKYGIDKDDYFIFIPRGLLRHNNIHLIFEALGHLKKYLEPEEFERINLFVKTANACDDSYLKEIQVLKSKYNLKRVLIEKGILEPIDYATLCKRANLSIFMSKNDLLTNAIIDMIYARTDLILSDIGPYRELINRYDLDITLCDIDETKLALSIMNYIKGKQPDGKSDNLSNIGDDFVFDVNAKNNVNIYRD